MAVSRRRFMAGAGAFSLIAPGARAKSPNADGLLEPDDEAAWAKIAAFYDVTDAVTHAESGYWGMMARPVLDAYLAYTERVNRQTSYYARREYAPAFKSVVEETAARLGAGPDEVALTRGASEALQGIIGGYRRLSPGDAVMYADIDYHSIQATMRALARREDCRVVELAAPEAAAPDAMVDFYREGLDENPETKFLLLTHISHRTGALLPAREIVALARERGVDVVVDAAHSWGQVDFTVDDLGADFVGFNLHKWIGAPLGVGAAYIKRGRLDDIAPNMSAADHEMDKISGRIHTGTANFAAYLTVPHAFAFLDRVGGSAREARLRYLRSVWTAIAREAPNVKILTADDPRAHAAITSFRIDGAVSVDANKAIVTRLLDEHGVFTVHRDGLANGACVRVTPGLFNGANDMRKVGRAVASLARSIPG